MIICTEKWTPRRMPIAAPTKDIHARQSSPISSTQKKRMLGRLKHGGHLGHDVAKKHAGQHVRDGDQHQDGDEDGRNGGDEARGRLHDAGS